MSDGNPPGVRNGGIGSAAKAIAEHASSIARLELELAAAEMKQKTIALGIGGGLLAASAVFGVFMVAFAFATAAAALALVVDWWLSLLIVTASLGLIATVLGLVGIRKLKKGSPPVPRQTIEEAKRTQEVLRR